MSTPVRINDDNYAQLQQEADKERRSTVRQLNHILDMHFGRDTYTPNLIEPEHKDTTPVEGTTSAGYCPDGHRYVDGRKGCMAKGCKYSIYKRSK